LLEYDKWRESKIHSAKLELDLVKKELCYKRLEEIMDELYSDIKDKAIYKKILENLKEVAKKYLYVQNGHSVKQNIRDFNYQVDQLYKNIMDIQ
jgi:hypothetical protein